MYKTYYLHIKYNIKIMKKFLFHVRRIILMLTPTYPKRKSVDEIHHNGKFLWEKLSQGLNIVTNEDERFETLYEFQSRSWKLNAFELYEMVEYIDYYLENYHFGNELQTGREEEFEQKYIQALKDLSHAIGNH